VMPALEQFQPDLILMDLNMPGANGIELTALKKRPTSFSEPRKGIWEIPVKGGDPVLLTRGGSYDSLESPDGKYLYFAAPLLAGIRRIRLAPRQPDGTPVNQAEEVIRETLPVSGHRFWTLGHGGIFFVDAQKMPALLKYVSLETRKVTVLATLPKPPAKFTKGLSISPDGRFALYCQDDLDRYEIRIVANFR